MQNNDNSKLKFFLYARKSSESEDRQIQSIDDQVSRLTTLSNSLNLEIVETYIEAKSAKKPGCRPVFSEMLERIEKGEANSILVWQINRLSRNPIDSGTISWMLQQGNLRCIQTIDRQYLPDDNVLLFSVESGMANQYIIDLKKNSRRGMIGKAERGWFPSLAPVGYLNNKLEHTIVDDKERFDLVRKMWDLMLTGSYTPPEIFEIANKRWGFRTVKYKRVGGKELSKNAVYYMFSNIFYTGMFEWAGTLYNGNHTPMITLEEFDKVQVLLGRKGKPRLKTHDFAYTGIIHCAECGGMVTATEKEKLVKQTGQLKKYVYYHCTHKRKSMNCRQQPLRIADLEQQIDELLERFTIHPQFEKWAIDVLEERKSKFSEDKAKITNTQQQSLKQAKQELENLTRMRMRDLINDAQFIKERDLVNNKITRLQSEITKPENQQDKIIELTKNTFHFATHAKEKLQNGTDKEKRQVLLGLGQNFSLKDKKLNIDKAKWFIPIEKAYPELKKEYDRLELEKYLNIEARNAAFSSLILNWLATLDEVRTFFLKHHDEHFYIHRFDLDKYILP